MPQIPARINAFLGGAIKILRERFGGRVTYASLPFEGVDWTAFDIVATDAGYRSVEVADRFRESIRAFVAQGKPVAITEFGCTTHRGAAAKGGRGDQIIEWGENGRPIRLNGDYIRDEGEQARYLHELLDIFNAEGVDSAFVSTFARFNLPHRGDPREDLDMASYGVVKVLEARLGDTYPEMAWEPKAAFTALADYYRGTNPNQGWADVRCLSAAWSRGGTRQPPDLPPPDSPRRRPELRPADPSRLRRRHGASPAEAEREEDGRRRRQPPLAGPPRAGRARTGRRRRARRRRGPSG
jgi:hypothetical protein